eukprot:3886-Heterococcus_DN1.PRE.1
MMWLMPLKENCSKCLATTTAATDVQRAGASHAYYYSVTYYCMMLLPMYILISVLLLTLCAYDLIDRARGSNSDGCDNHASTCEASAQVLPSALILDEEAASEARCASVGIYRLKQPARLAGAVLAEVDTWALASSVTAVTQ